MFQSLQLNPQNKILLISFIIFILLYLILKEKNKEPHVATENKPLYADTLIPKGQVLVPIELANLEAVSGLIDQYGIIDLYGGPENSSALIASRVKILRAPLNPNQYAVMVTEILSQEIMKYKGPFWAVIQNRFTQNERAETKNKSEVKNLAVKPKGKVDLQTSKIEIEYHQGDE